VKTLKNIAEEIGVSEAAVSYVYNNKWKQNKISPLLAKKVSKKLKEEKYRPNSLGLQLKTKKTRTIGIILGDLTRNFNLNIMAGIERVLTQKEYFSLVCSSNLGKLEEEQLEMLLQRNTDGIIFAPHSNRKNTLKVIRSLMEEKTPIILVDNYLRGLKTDFVVSDNYLGTYQAVRHILRNGKNKVAYIGSKKGLTALDDRFKGYKTALKEADIPLKENLICWQKEKYQDIYSSIEVLFSEGRPDALFVESLMYFKEGFRFLAEKGYKIPDDIVLVGFDPVDINISKVQEVDFHSVVSRPIPFVEQQGIKMGEIAAEIILDRVEGKRRKLSQVFLKPELKFFNGKENNGQRI
jgi:LacI family transcriptional regulator